MDSKRTPDSIIEWEFGKEILTVAYDGCEYLADTWPKRLGFDDLVVLQSEGNSTHFKAWKTCLLHAVNAGEIPIQDEQWFVGTCEPSKFWTGSKPRAVIIPPCHKHKGDNIQFFAAELLTKYTVSPKDFAEYLKKHDKQPSKYIAAWFCAYGVDIETDKTSDETEPVEKIRVLIPMQRAKTELLTLIYNFLSGHCKIEVGDKKPMDSKAAWGLLVSEKYKSDIIRDIQGRRGTSTITLNNETEVDYKEFAKTYNERFKPPQ